MLRSFSIWFLSLALLAAGYDGLKSEPTAPEPQTLGEDGSGAPPPPTR
jgi:hypothetical protein